MANLSIQPLTLTPGTLDGLCEMLIETVAHGGSVSFMHPLDPAVAHAFWTGALAAAGRGERIVLGAFDGDALVGTVSLITDTPPNQPHRGDIAKMMTRISHRGRGIARALLARAEALAAASGRTLLTLDTAAEEGAAGLYEKAGFHFAGEIPDYALKPHGGLTATRLYWKRIGAGG